MFAAPPPARRSPVSLALSLALHACLATAGVVLAAAMAARPVAPDPGSLTFVAALAPPEALVRLTAPPETWRSRWSFRRPAP